MLFRSNPQREYEVMDSFDAILGETDIKSTVAFVTMVMFSVKKTVAGDIFNSARTELTEMAIA